MGLALLILGLILFLGTHVLVTMRGERARLVKRLGEMPYKGLFTVVSLAGLYLIGEGFALYRDAGEIVLWSPAGFSALRHATADAARVHLSCRRLPSGQHQADLKHPMLVAVKTWAVAHLLVNGDLGGIILFGSVLGWAVYDRISLKHRSDPGGPPIPQGGRRNDIAAVIVGVILYFALAFPFPCAISSACRYSGRRRSEPDRNVYARRRPHGGSPRRISARARAASLLSCSPPTMPIRRAFSMAIAT